VEIHGQHPVDPGLDQKIGHQLGGDRLAARRFAIGPGIAVVGHHRCDLTGGGTATGIHHDQQLHQVIVHRSTGGLDQEDIAAADRFLDLDVKLSIGEALDHPWAIGDPEVGADLPGQIRIGGAAEQAQQSGDANAIGLELLGDVRTKQSLAADARTAYQAALALKPERAERKRIEAKLKDGVLTVKLAKAERFKPRSIAVN